MKLDVKYIIYIIPALAVISYSCGTGRNAVSRGSSHGMYSESRTELYSNEIIDSQTIDDQQNIFADKIVKEAKTWLGTPYSYGGHSKKGTDCSGMVMEVYLKTINLKLPRTAQKQQKFCRSISRSTLRPGDLIFFSLSRDSGVSHVGIYIGNDIMIHASSKQGVIESNIYDTWYDRHYHSAGVIISPIDESKTDPQEQIEALEKTLEMKTDSILSVYMD